MCNSYSEMDFNARVDVNVDVHVQIDGKLDAVSHLQLRKTRSNNKKKINENDKIDCDFGN